MARHFQFGVVALVFAALAAAGCGDPGARVVDDPFKAPADVATYTPGPGPDTSTNTDNPPPTGDSCAGVCGVASATAGCGCDNACHERGDCCTDKIQLCGPYKPPAPTAKDSCKGWCGHKAPSGNCACSNKCHEEGNCCADKEQWCGPYEPPNSDVKNTCKGYCGGEAPGGCWCHNACHENGTCCPDKTDFCGDYKPPPPPASESCNGKCGGTAASGCGCDNACHDAGSCCGDKELFCGPYKPPPPPPTETCKGICGGQAISGCWCNNECHNNGNCCQDKELFCGPYKPPPGADSCQGICGQAAPSGCWCNNDCHVDDNCCPDKVAKCGPYKPPEEPAADSCVGICGQQADSGCWCHNDCTPEGNCCADKLLVCGPYKPPPPDESLSCVGICGQEAPGGCACNDACHAAGNCCEDKEAQCGAAPDSCKDRCGEEAPSGCSCVDGCEADGSCCADKADLCGTPGDLEEGTCEGNCDKQTPQGCWCDATCEQYDDCCADKGTFCGDEPPPPAGSCEGLCGLQTPEGCWCGENCEQYDDCCPDKVEKCGAGDPVDEASCAGICGEQAASGCWCDDTCEDSGDCCQDKAATCGETTCEKLGHAQGECSGFLNGSMCGEDGNPYDCQTLEGYGLKCWVQTATCAESEKCSDPLGPTGAHCESDPASPLNSCVDKCGGQAPGGCWCDNNCEQAGDCCPDKESACGETTCADLGYPLGSCSGFLNGSKCEEGQPYECQTKGVLKCWVQTDTCGEAEKCVDPFGPTGAHCETDPDNDLNSCAGKCGEQAAGGCWCDKSCAQNGDCCPDKVEACGETTCEDLGYTLGSCGLFSGSKCEDNQPYACQEVAGMDCWVQTEVCGEGQTCKDPFGPSSAKCETDPDNELNSCAGKCGGQAAGGCWCDDQCDQNGDCCPDKEDQCGKTTCEDLSYALGSCGFLSGSKCEGGQPYECQDVGSLDCWVQTATCADGEKCEDPFGPSGAKCVQDDESPINSCVGNCGKQAPGGCWCDPNCEANGDCCADKKDQCGETTCESLGFDGGGCTGFLNGSKCDGGDPWECQDKGPVNCWIKIATCASGEKCTDPLGPAGAKCVQDDESPVNSCAGNCGGQAPGGCWCDPKCEGNGDCCADKKSECGATTCESLGFNNGGCNSFLNGSKCDGGNPWECQDKGPVECWVKVATCTSAQKCEDPLGPAGAKCVEDNSAPANSCAGSCGGKAPGGCWCDHQCVVNGDCCSDKKDKCGDSTCEDVGYSLGSCGAFSGSKCEGGNPYECTEKGALDCWVQTDTCGPGEKCVDPFGPAGAQCKPE